MRRTHSLATWRPVTTRLIQCLLATWLEVAGCLFPARALPMQCQAADNVRLAANYTYGGKKTLGVHVQFSKRGVF